MIDGIHEVASDVVIVVDMGHIVGKFEGCHAWKDATEFRAALKELYRKTKGIT